MKMLSYFALMFFSINTYAGIDGIYSCNVNAKGTQLAAYISINSRDTQTIFAVAAITASNAFYGYGIGSVVGNIFSGQTMALQPFSFSVSENSLIGTVGILPTSGGAYTATGNCQKVW